MTILLDELQERWRAIFRALAAGDDVAPAQRLRTEGMMEAALLLEPDGQQQLLRAMESCYESAFGQSIAAMHGKNWRSFFPFPQIPAMARRAPVFPSTSD